jgi:hypothetical protein
LLEMSFQQMGTGGRKAEGGGGGVLSSVCLVEWFFSIASVTAFLRRA